MSSDKKRDKDEVRESAPSKSPKNLFQNDGSFMEMFKRMQGQQTQPPSATSSSASTTAPPVERKEGYSSKGREEEAKQDTEAPCYTTQTIYYKDGVRNDEKPQYQVTVFLSLFSRVYLLCAPL